MLSDFNRNTVYSLRLLFQIHVLGDPGLILIRINFLLFNLVENLKEKGHSTKCFLKGLLIQRVLRKAIIKAGAVIHPN